MEQITNTKDKISNKQIEDLLNTLKTRFEKNPDRHKGLSWSKVFLKLQTVTKEDPKKLLSLYEMEKTGGEPDVIEYDQKTETFVFYDCSPESPKDRRSLCYDHKALEDRKTFKPKSSAIGTAGTMGIELLSEAEYKRLQELGSFDTKTSSWIKTPSEIRKLGGALFADRRFDHVFIYHNGADSYYAARGFRGSLKI